MARPFAAKAASAEGTWRSLASISRWPPGASQPGAPAATRRSTSSPSAPAVQGEPRLVRPGLGRQQPDLPGRHVGHVGDQDGDPAAQPGGQRLVQVALVDVPGHVLPGAAYGGRVEVGRVHVGPVHGRGHRGPDRARATAQVDDDVPRPGQGDGLLDEELRAPARDEDAGRHGDPQAAELRPAQDVLKRQARGALVHHGVKLVRRPRRGVSSRPRPRRRRSRPP